MLFQKNILKKYTDAVPQDVVAQAWQQYQSYFLNPEIQANIRQSKEEQFQEGFLRELFVKVLGYTLNPSPDYNLITEQKNETNSRKADGAILVDGKVVGIIELKDHKTTDLSKIEQQAFGYKSQNQNAVYVVISNFEKLRFYIDNAVECVEFDLFHLTENEFCTLWLCLAYTNIAANLPKRIKTESVSSEDAITNALYRDYTNFKRVLYQDICANNDVADDDARVELYKKTQKLLDRMLFIFFAEDSGLLPPNTMIRIIDDWRKLADLDAYVPLYERIKKYFGYLDTGYKGKDYEIFAYNGGLFKPDDVLDSLKITDSVLEQHTRRLSEYDYQSEVDVNILGHIFENSLNEIEAVAAPTDAAPSTTKRKRDGVFYTPQYITKYIVENTVGRLCADKKAELQIDEQEYFADRRRNKDTKIKLLKRLNDYRQWLLQITICDPACGSGAFLNAALQFLIQEHRLIDEMDAKITDSPMVIPNVENSILENNLFGVDINEESVEIARLSLWLRTARPHRKLNSLNQNIKCGNSLISDPDVAADKAFDWQREFPQVFERGGFDVVIGNPPYGATFNDAEKAFITKSYKSYRYKYESYIYFIEKSLNLVKDEGFVEFITPQLWLSLDESYNIRNIVLNNDLQTIRFYGEDAFADAVVNTCSFMIRKKAPNNELVIIDIAERKRLLSKSDVIEKETLKINYRLDNMQMSIIKKLQLNTRKLSYYGTVIQGITPYDKHRGQSEEIIKNRAYHHTEKIDDTCGYWLEGQDVSRYSVCWSGNWLSYGTWLAAPREKKYFEGARILFREIPGQGKRLQAAYYNEVAYYGHSISPFKLNQENESLLKAILGCVNSKLISWYGALLLPNLSKDIFPKVNPKDISELPIPNELENDTNTISALANLADKMLTLNADLQQKVSRFLRRITETYNLEKTTAALETFYTLSFSDFVKELGKQKVKLTLVQKDELEDYFNAYQSECQSLKTAIATTDHEIDRMVYALYGLTDEEIGVVEN
ncbi:MAG: N-6 DNA methylase [Salinivirgaceae bacterium]|nr:N-6 DNA methylase [Salinivirgaceae bacterium]